MALGALSLTGGVSHRADATKRPVEGVTGGVGQAVMLSAGLKGLLPKRDRRRVTPSGRHKAASRGGTRPCLRTLFYQKNDIVARKPVFRKGLNQTA